MPTFPTSINQLTSYRKKKGIISNALTEKVIATTGIASSFCNNALLDIVYKANIIPAIREYTIPIGLIVISPLFKNKNKHPTIAKEVDIPQILVGRNFKNNHSIIPENTGALPIATTLAMATPVNRTEEKNNSWNKDIQMAAYKVSFHGQVLNLIFFSRIIKMSKEKPPTAERPALITKGCASFGKKVCAVPVVPQRIAPSKTKIYGRTDKLFHSFQIFHDQSKQTDKLAKLYTIEHIEILLSVHYTIRDRRHLHMYMTVDETADYLSMPIDQVKRYIAEKKIRAIFDGEDYYVNSAQFQTHLQQVEDLKRQIDEWRNTPIPDDIDVKDED